LKVKNAREPVIKKKRRKKGDDSRDHAGEKEKGNSSQSGSKEGPTRTQLLLVFQRKRREKGKRSQPKQEEGEKKKAQQKSSRGQKERETLLLREKKRRKRGYTSSTDSFLTKGREKKRETFGALMRGAVESCSSRGKGEKGGGCAREGNAAIEPSSKRRSIPDIASTALALGGRKKGGEGLDKRGKRGERK